MSDYGIEFETGLGKKFRLDAINPHVYLETITLTGAGNKSHTVSYPSLNGLMEISAVLSKCTTGGSPVHSGMGALTMNIEITTPSANPASVTFSVSPIASTSRARYTFDIYARGIK